MSPLSPSTLAELLQYGLEAGKLPYVTVTSNSMAPLLKAGDQVAIERVSAEELRPGDLIMVETTAELLTHRYWQGWEQNGQHYLLTRGDRLIQFDSPWPTGRLIGRVVARRRGLRYLELDNSTGEWLNQRLMGIIRLEMKLLTGRPAIADYQTQLLRLHASNGRPYLWVRLLRRLLWLWAELLAAAVGLLARSTSARA
jgi:signal peptidase I